MQHPQPDSSAYDGSIIVKTKVARKEQKDDSANYAVDRAKKVVEMLSAEVDKRLTIDRLDPNGPQLIEVQLLVNKEVVAELRKVINTLNNFIRNN